MFNKEERDQRRTEEEQRRQEFWEKVQEKSMQKMASRYTKNTTKETIVSNLDDLHALVPFTGLFNSKLILEDDELSSMVRLLLYSALLESLSPDDLEVEVEEI